LNLSRFSKNQNRKISCNIFLKLSSRRFYKNIFKSKCLKRILKTRLLKAGLCFKLHFSFACPLSVSQRSSSQCLAAQVSHPSLCLSRWSPKAFPASRRQWTPSPRRRRELTATAVSTKALCETIWRAQPKLWYETRHQRKLEKKPLFFLHSSLLPKLVSLEIGIQTHSFSPRVRVMYAGGECFVHYVYVCPLLSDYFYLICADCFIAFVQFHGCSFENLLY